MNAGTKNGECMTVVEAVELATPDGLGWVSQKISFHYRHTELPPAGIVTRIRFALRGAIWPERQEDGPTRLSQAHPAAEPAQLRQRLHQPPGIRRALLIEAVNLKGHLGSAQISTLHANWIVNLGSATCGRHRPDGAQAQVLEDVGVDSPEVKRIGRFR